MTVAVLVLAALTFISALFSSVLVGQYRHNPDVQYAGVNAWSWLTALLATATLVLAILLVTT